MGWHKHKQIQFTCLVFEKSTPKVAAIFQLVPNLMINPKTDLFIFLNGELVDSNSLCSLGIFNLALSLLRTRTAGGRKTHSFPQSHFGEHFAFLTLPPRQPATHVSEATFV